MVRERRWCAIVVGVVSSDVPPCEFYRSAGPAQCLADAGEIEMVRLGGPTLTVRYANRKHGPLEPVGLVNPPEVDVVVFVRGVFPERMHDVIKFLQRDGIAIVVDYDDAYRNLPPQLQGRYKITPTMNPHYNWKWAGQAGKIADAVTVSTPALLRYHPNATVLPNCIPESYLKIKHQGDGATIGWTGTVHGHPGDLTQCGGGVTEAMAQTGARFLNVGDGYKVREQLGLSEMPLVTEFVTLEQYPYEVAKIDVGIAPLHDSTYSDAKSWLKPAEYLALGAAYVASPQPEYLALQAQLEEWCALSGAQPPGAIAKSRGRNWRSAIVKALQMAPEERQIGREFIRERLLMESYAPKWAEVWEDAVKRRRHGGQRAA